MFNVMRSELYRIFKSKMIYVFMGITALLPILSLVFIHFLSADAIAAGMPLPEYNQGVFFVENSREFVSGGLGMLFALLMGVMILGEEYQGGILKVKLLEVNRLTLFVSKIMTLFVSLLSVMGVQLVVGYVVGGFYYGFDMSIDAWIDGAVGLIFSYQTIVVSSILFMTFGMFFRKASSAIGAGIGLILVWSTLINFIPDYLTWLVPHGFVVKALNLGMEQYGIWAVLSLGGYMVLGLFGGYGYFRRKDLTL